MASFVEDNRQFKIVGVYQSAAWDKNRVPKNYYQQYFRKMNFGSNPFQGQSYRSLMAFVLISDRNWITHEDLVCDHAVGPLVDWFLDIYPLPSSVPVASGGQSSVKRLQPTERELLEKRNPMLKQVLETWKFKYYPHLETFKWEDPLLFFTVKPPWGIFISKRLKWCENRKYGGNWKIDKEYETDHPMNGKKIAYRCRLCMQHKQWKDSCGCADKTRSAKEKEAKK